MSKKVYNKLVRSEIPEIIKSEGRECMYIELDSADEEQRKSIKNLLLEKVVEEAQEIKNSKNKGELLEEVGDLLDVIDELLSLESIGTYNSYNEEHIKGDLEVIRKAKQLKKGSFRMISNHSYHNKYIKLLSVDYEK